MVDDLELNLNVTRIVTTVMVLMKLRVMGFGGGSQSFPWPSTKKKGISHRALRLGMWLVQSARVEAGPALSEEFAWLLGWDTKRREEKRRKGWAQTVDYSVALSDILCPIRTDARR